MTGKPQLLFIDTNIFLDFYRCRNDAAISLLAHLDAIPDRIITTYQVEMEFKKHRQHAILESINQLKAPVQIARPGMFSDAKSFRALQKDLENAGKRVKTLKQRLKQVFLNPTTQDEVYKVAQRLFNKDDEISLSREKKVRFHIRRLAWKRFVLGYPPRKQGDTSIGDAINWEWIVWCAARSQSEIYIVSRDSDYGVTLENDSFINDWLLQEFRSRVKTKRRIYLYSRLSEALKLFAIPVTKAEEEAEEKIITESQDVSLSGLDQFWIDFVSNVRSSHPFLASYLSEGRLQYLSQEEVVVVFNNPDFQGMVNVPKNRAILQAKLADRGYSASVLRLECHEAKP